MIDMSLQSYRQKSVLFILAQAVSLLGSSLVQFAIVWHVTLSTSSGIMMAISTICCFLPQIIISLFAGVWVDRYNRKLLIMLSDGIIALSTFVLAILFLSGHRSLWLLFFVSCIRSAGSGVQTPAINAIIPQMVPKKQLIRITGINTSIQSLITLLSPALSGALLSVTNIEMCFFIDVITAIFGISIMFFIKVTPFIHTDETPTTKGAIEELKSGFRYIKQHHVVFSVLCFYALFMFFATPVSYLTPLLVTRSFGENIWQLTANELLFSLGTMLGGVYIAFWGGFENRRKTISIAYILFGICTIGLGSVTHFIYYLVIIFLSGFIMPSVTSPSTVLLQEVVSPTMHGRVFSVIQIVSSVSVPSGMLIFGPLADICKIEYILIITGIITLVTGILFYRNRKKV